MLTTDQSVAALLVGRRVSAGDAEVTTLLKYRDSSESAASLTQWSIQLTWSRRAAPDSKAATAKFATQIWTSSDPPEVLSKLLEGIAQHYIGGTISLTGVVLNPSLPLAAWNPHSPVQFVLGDFLDGRRYPAGIPALLGFRGGWIPSTLDRAIRPKLNLPARMSAVTFDRSRGEKEKWGNAFGKAKAWRNSRKDLHLGGFPAYRPSPR
jgi:hypothetical protein